MLQHKNSNQRLNSLMGQTCKNAPMTLRTPVAVQTADGGLLLTFKANYRENTAVACDPPAAKCPKNRTSVVFAPLLSLLLSHSLDSVVVVPDNERRRRRQLYQFPPPKKRTRLRSALRVAFSPPLQFRLKSGNAKCRLCVQNPMKMFRAS